MGDGVHLHFSSEKRLARGGGLTRVTRFLCRGQNTRQQINDRMINDKQVVGVQSKVLRQSTTYVDIIEMSHAAKLSLLSKKGQL